MDTIVTAKVIGDSPESTIRAALDRALGWFHEVERVCSRFDRQSEVFLLSSQVGHPVQVSPMLFEAVRFGVEVATISGGLFDPTVGAAQARRGFDRNYATGERTAPPDADGVVSYMDVVLDSERQAITLRKPILIDLGALAKGMAIDLAAPAGRGMPGALRSGPQHLGARQAPHVVVGDVGDQVVGGPLRHRGAASAH